MLTKKRLLSLLWIITCLVLWVLGFLWTSFILMLIGWIILIQNYPLGKMIKKSIGMVFLFLLFYVVSIFRIFELRTDFGQPCWSPDGKQIAFFMTKSLFRVHPGVPFSAWTAEDIWKKYYLCTMDYDGGDFKVVKDIEELIGNERISLPYMLSWTNKGAIIITGGYPYAEVYQINSYGEGLEKIYTLESPWRISGRAWLSPKGKYLAINYSDTLLKDLSKMRILVFDIGSNKEIKRIETSKVDYFFGSYTKNEFAYIEADKLTKYDIATKKKEIIDIRNKNATGILPDYELLFGNRHLSPDRSMYASAGGVWTLDNKVVSNFYIKPKRSYLFNIFQK